MNYLWDTNIAIYYLQQQFPLAVEKFIDDLLIDHKPILSVISEIELLSWKTSNEQDLNVIKDFLSDSSIIELDQSIKIKTAEFRKTTGIKLPDAIIAATATVLDLTLLSRNTRDFKKCSDVKVFNPFEESIQ